MKKFALGILSIILALSLIDFLITRYGEKKYYEVVQKNSLVRANLAKGILVYGDSNIYFFKWQIDSIKEITKQNK